MPSTDALANWLRLTLAPGIGSETQRRLLADFGLPDHIFAASAATLGRTVPLQQAERLLSQDSGNEIAMALAWAAEPGNCHRGGRGGTAADAKQRGGLVLDRKPRQVGDAEHVVLHRVPDTQDRRLGHASRGSVTAQESVTA